jgi:hypothetical protein
MAEVVGSIPIGSTMRRSTSAPFCSPTHPGGGSRFDPDRVHPASRCAPTAGSGRSARSPLTHDPDLLHEFPDARLSVLRRASQAVSSSGSAAAHSAISVAEGLSERPWRSSASSVCSSAMSTSMPTLSLRMRCWQSASARLPAFLKHQRQILTVHHRRVRSTTSAGPIACHRLPGLWTFRLATRNGSGVSSDASGAPDLTRGGRSWP